MEKPLSDQQAMSSAAIEQLTHQQAEVAAAIEQLTHRQGYPPSNLELAAELGYSSCNSVQCHLRTLERRGMITRRYGQARTVRLTPRGWLAVFGQLPPGSATHEEAGNG